MRKEVPFVVQYVTIWHLQVIMNCSRDRGLGKLRIREEVGSVGGDHLNVKGEEIVNRPVACRLSRSYEVCHDDDDGKEAKELVSQCG